MNPSGVMTYEESRAHWLEQKRQRDERQAKIDAMRPLVRIAVHRAVEQYRQDLIDLAGVASYFFKQEAEGKTFTRRPPLSLTIPAAGDPIGWLIVYPGWDKKAKYLHHHHINIELMVERVAGKPTSEMEIRIPCCMFIEPHSWSILWGEEGISRVTEAASAFLHDPLATFTKAVGHCCICRHKLKDEVSKARGIGPECLRHATFFRNCAERYLAVRGQQNATSSVEVPS